MDSFGSKSSLPSRSMPALSVLVDAVGLQNKNRLVALAQAQNDDAEDEMRALAASVYESKSGSIVVRSMIPRTKLRANMQIFAR